MLFAGLPEQIQDRQSLFTRQYGSSIGHSPPSAFARLCGESLSEEDVQDSCTDDKLCVNSVPFFLSHEGNFRVLPA